MSIIDTLITDRTEADFDRAIALAGKGWDAMTDAEKAEWSSNLKGAYNISDIIRVTAAMEYLTDLLRGYGYNVDYQPVSITHADGTTDTTWQETDEPTYSQLERYRLNVAAVRSVLAMLPTTPETPARIVASSVGATDGLTWAGANDIERILIDVDTLITSMMDICPRCGQAMMYSGFALYPIHAKHDVPVDETVLITITGSGDATYCYIEINGVVYTSAASVSCKKSSSIRVYSGGTYTGSISLDGTTVASGKSSSYQLVANSPSTINLTVTRFGSTVTSSATITSG